METRVCPTCNKRFASFANFCGFCGTRLHQEEEPELKSPFITPEERKTRHLEEPGETSDAVHEIINDHIKADISNVEHTKSISISEYMPENESVEGEIRVNENNDPTQPLSDAQLKDQGEEGEGSDERIVSLFKTTQKKPDTATDEGKHSSTANEQSDEAHKKIYPFPEHSHEDSRETKTFHSEDVTSDTVTQEGFVPEDESQENTSKSKDADFNEEVEEGTSDQMQELPENEIYESASITSGLDVYSEDSNDESADSSMSDRSRANAVGSAENEQSNQIPESENDLYNSGDAVEDGIESSEADTGKADITDVVSHIENHVDTYFDTISEEGDRETVQEEKSAEETDNEAGEKSPPPLTLQNDSLSRNHAAEMPIQPLVTQEQHEDFIRQAQAIENVANTLSEAISSLQSNMDDHFVRLNTTLELLHETVVDQRSERESFKNSVSLFAENIGGELKNAVEDLDSKFSSYYEKMTEAITSSSHGGDYSKDVADALSRISISMDSSNTMMIQIQKSQSALTDFLEHLKKNNSVS